MESIILFTDYSAQSFNAGRYAIHLARKLKCSIIISDAISQKTHVLEPIGNDLANYSENEDASLGAAFIEFSHLLQNELLNTHCQNNFIPPINCDNRFKDAAEAISTLQSYADIAFIIIPANVYYGYSSIMPDNNLNRILHAANSPIIVVPENAPIRYAEKYAFITEISESNLPVLNQLAKIAQISAATMMLVNINPGRPLQTDQQLALEVIMKELVNSVDYGRIYFRQTPDHVAKASMEWLFEDNHFEALAFVFNKRDIYKRLLLKGLNEPIKGSINVPVFIYPV